MRRSTADSSQQRLPGWTKVLFLVGCLSSLWTLVDARIFASNNDDVTTAILMDVDGDKTNHDNAVTVPMMEDELMLDDYQPPLSSSSSSSSFIHDATTRTTESQTQTGITYEHPQELVRILREEEELEQEQVRQLNPLATATWETITFDDFETGTWGSYVNGGSQAVLAASNDYFATLLPTNTRSRYSALIRDDNAPPDSSFFHRSWLDVSLYDTLQLDFWYHTRGMKNTVHRFFIDYSVNAATGTNAWTNWATISTFQDKVALRYTLSWTLPVSPPIMTIKLRFRCQGKDSKTQVYVDQIRLQGRRKTQAVVELPSSRPSSMPSTMPTKYALTNADICPIDRRYPPTKFEIEPYRPLTTTAGVEDDLSEISSLVFSNQTDAAGNLYAYVASDKNQFSIKVLQFPPRASYSSIGSPRKVVQGSVKTVATYALNVPSINADWEDISLGPCDGSAMASTCLYIGDFGNNPRGGGYVQRSTMQIYKFPEPIFQGSNPRNLTNVAVTTISYRHAAPGFDESLFYDAEAMFVDWTGSSSQTGTGKGDIYIVTKGACTLGKVGIIPASYHATLMVGNGSGGPIYPMQAIMPQPPKQGDIITCSQGEFRAFQGADMSRNGRLIALITGQSPPRVYFYPRASGESVLHALTSDSASVAASCSYVASTSYGLSNERQHEAVAFLPDGQSFADTSECQGGSHCNVPIYFWDLLWPTSPNVFQHGSAPAPNDPAWFTISWDDFEAGDHLGKYIAGSQAVPSQGPTCPLVRYPSSITTTSATNQWSMLVYGHEGALSAFWHGQNQAAASLASWLKIHFDFRLDGFDHMDTLFLELSLDGGTSYFMVADWAMDTQGIKQWNVCYSETVVLNASVFGRTTFGNAVRLRFRTSANALNDKVYIDNVWFLGHAGSNI